jgi:DNA-binding IclR family transcriptional regulator
MTEQVIVSRPDRELARAVESSKAPAISRAAAVLRLLGKSDTPLGVQAIARKLGLVPSTCLYVLRALVAEELVSFDPLTKRYALEAGVLTLARHWLRRNRFNDLAEPALERLSQTFGVTMLGGKSSGSITSSSSRSHTPVRTFSSALRSAAGSPR